MSRDRKQGFFVMLHNQNGRPVLLTSEDPQEAGTTGDAVLFENEAEARRAAQAHPLGKNNGFQIYPWRVTA